MKQALFLVVSLLALPILAAEIFFEGRLVSGDSPCPSTTALLTPRLYSEPVRGEILEGWSPVSIQTDEKGYFSLYLPEKDLGRLSGELWLGGVVSGSDGEVMPRRKLVSAPYAIHTRLADYVRLDRAEGLKSLMTGKLETRRLESEESVVLSGDPAFSSSVQGVRDLHLGTISIGTSGSFSALRPALGSGAMTQDYDSFQADGSFQVEKNEEKEVNLAAEKDGFLVVVAKSDHSGGQAKFFFTLKVGPVTYCDGRDIDTDDDPKGLVFTVPVRAGDAIQIKARCQKSGTYWHRAFVKYRSFYFGR